MEFRPHRPTLGTFRFVLAAIVFFSHIAPRPFDFLYTMTDGYIAVVMFFVVSGYLISNGLETFYVGRVREFVVNRFLRIYPSYWVVLAATMGALSIHGVARIDGFNGAAVIGWTDWNATVVSVFAFGFIGVSWSLRVEIFFYLTIAAVYFFVNRLWPERLKQRAIYGACLVALAAYALCTGLSDFFWATPIPHIPYFVLGIALSRLWLGRDSPIASAILLGCSLLLVFVAFHHAGVPGAHVRLLEPIELKLGPDPRNLFNLGALLAIFVGLLALNIRGLLRLIDNFLGDLSYPLFLCHFTANAVIGYQFAYLPDMQRVWLAIAVSLGASVLLWWCIDSRVVGLRDRVRGVALYTFGPAHSRRLIRTELRV